MGQKLSMMSDDQKAAKLNDLDESENDEEGDDISENNGFLLGGIQLSPEVVNTLLSHVPAESLLCNCRLVCKNWNALIEDQTLWRLKCDRQGIPVPRLLLQQMPLHFYRALVMKNPYGRNLIRNPCGDEGMRYWHYTNGGDGWLVEKPPQGADDFNTVEDLQDIERCFSTSFQECKKHQVIDLVQEGCHTQILDELQPEILISDWYAARFDCACRYILTATLMDGRRQPKMSFTFGPHDTAQWEGKAWKKVEHRFKSYGPGIRYIRFLHVGHDRQFWAGNFGCKMTNSTVRVLLPQ